MAKDDKLKELAGSESGFRVPEGYFPKAFAKISASLPERKPALPEPRSSVWQRVKPFVYLAAMFAGIWCMMQMFHIASQQPSVSLDNPPAVFAQVADSDDFLGSYTSAGYEDDYQLEEDLATQYGSIDEFIEDFDYQLEDKYNNIDVSQVSKILNNQNSHS